MDNHWWNIKCLYSERGIIPRAIQLIFNEISRRQKEEMVEFTITVSYMEIYQGKGYDLLTTTEVNDIHDLPHVQQFTRPDGKLFLRNLSATVVKDEGDALQQLWHGDSNRTLAETDANPNSSRSHCVFSIGIESKEPDSSVVKFSKLHIVDLAGSERVYKTGAENTIKDKKLVREALYINISLHFLERVIHAISEKSSHVPYRASLLTTILKNSIGGNCKTVMVTNINPKVAYFPETISTCRFSQRVANIRQEANINTRVDPYVLIAQLKKKVRSLEQKLAFYESVDDNESETLSHSDLSLIKQKIISFCQSKDEELDLGGKFNRIIKAFQIFRDIVNDKNINFEELEKKQKTSNNNSKNQESGEKENVEEEGGVKLEKNQIIIDKKSQNLLRNKIRLQEMEINILVDMLAKKSNKNQRHIAIQASGLNFAKKTNNFLKGKNTQKNNNEEENYQTEKVKELSNEMVKKKIEKMAETETKNLLPLNMVKEQLESYGMLDRAKAFSEFKKTYRKNIIIEKTKLELKKLIERAKKLSEVISKARKLHDQYIKQLKEKTEVRVTKGLVDRDIQSVKVQSEEEKMLKMKVFQTKKVYMEKVNDLRNTKKEIEHVTKGLERAQIRYIKDFERWYETMARENQ